MTLYRVISKVRRNKLRNFGLISDIEINEPETWLQKIFVTLDIDWADDSVIQFAAEVIEDNGCLATWFFTHNSPMIDILESKGHEVGIHPNFNPLLSGKDSSELNVIIDECLSWCPNAKSTRSHSLVYGAPIASYLSSQGVCHSSNLNIPYSSGIELKPWFSSNSMIEVPYSWADEHMWSLISQPSASDWSRGNGLLVADFHPIHIFLNSTSAEAYEQSRFCHRDPCALIDFRQTGYGTMNHLIALCNQG